MDLLYYILTGAIVGFAIGATGIGGGSLMTPILLALGFPLHIAVGTDLLFAAVTKGGGVVVHSLQHSVRWDLVWRLAAGSLPATALTVAALHYLFGSPEAYSRLITNSLGLALILTSGAVLCMRRLGDLATSNRRATEDRLDAWLPLPGAILGVLVTLSSVGAGAVGGAMLLVLYPRLTTAQVAGTSIAWAVPLTLCAGLGHLYLGNVDLNLLLALLAGSIPAISLGSRVARHTPDRIMRPLLASILCGVGVKFILF